MDLESFSQRAADYNNTIGLSEDVTTLGGIISKALPILITLGGLVLLIMLISGGLTMMTSATDVKAAEAGKQRITQALIGFFILFATYWIFQLLEIVPGISIVN